MFFHPLIGYMILKEAKTGKLYRHYEEAPIPDGFERIDKFKPKHSFREKSVWDENGIIIPELGALPRTECSHIKFF